MGDGFLATFDGPARAIRCACSARDAHARARHRDPCRAAHRRGRGDGRRHRRDRGQHRRARRRRGRRRRGAGLAHRDRPRRRLGDRVRRPRRPRVEGRARRVAALRGRRNQRCRPRELPCGECEEAADFGASRRLSEAPSGRAGVRAGGAGSRPERREAPMHPASLEPMCGTWPSIGRFPSRGIIPQRPDDEHDLANGPDLSAQIAGFVVSPATAASSAAPARMSCSDTSIESSQKVPHRLDQDDPAGDDRRRAVGVQARHLAPLLERQGGQLGEDALAGRHASAGSRRRARGS